MSKTHSLQDKRILATLRKSRKPMSAYDMLDAMRVEGIRSPPTVYRALDRLVQNGCAHRIESLGAYVACSCQHGPEKKAVNPLAICTHCGNVQEIVDPILDHAVQKLGASFLAQVDHKILELKGLCYACSGREKG